MAEIRRVKPSRGTFLPVHTFHWIQGRKFAEPAQSVIPVSMVGHDDGLAALPDANPNADFRAALQRLHPTPGGTS